MRDRSSLGHGVCLHRVLVESARPERVAWRGSCGLRADGGITLLGLAPRRIDAG